LPLENGEPGLGLPKEKRHEALIIESQFQKKDKLRMDKERGTRRAARQWKRAEEKRALEKISVGQLLSRLKVVTTNWMSTD